MIERRTPSRKLQGIGYSFFVCLPLEWIQHHGLSKHDRIRFRYGDNDELIMEPLIMENKNEIETTD